METSWKNGKMEWWSIGVMGNSHSGFSQHQHSVPHYSSFLISNVLREPFQRQRMAEPLGFRQVVSRPADCGELQSLCALVIEKSDLLIRRPSRPAACHNIRHGPDVRIIDLEVRRARNFFLFIGIACDKTEHAVAAGHHL